MTFIFILGISLSNIRSSPKNFQIKKNECNVIFGLILVFVLSNSHNRQNSNICFHQTRRVNTAPCSTSAPPAPLWPLHWHSISLTLLIVLSCCTWSTMSYYTSDVRSQESGVRSQDNESEVRSHYTVTIVDHFMVWRFSISQMLL